MKATTWIIGLQCLILIFGGFIVYQYLKTNERLVSDADYWRKQSFKTDTVLSSTRYSERVPYPEYVPPEQVMVPTPYIPQSFIRYTDSLLQVIDSSKDSQQIPVNIKPSYILQYPEASKLVGGSFTKNNITLDLLKTDGQIYQNSYPVDYSAFEYQYVNNSISAKELNARRNKNDTQNKLIRYDGTYLFYEKDLLKKQDNLHATISLDLWKIRLQGFAGYPITSPDKSIRAGGRVGFRLF